MLARVSAMPSFPWPRTRAPFFTWTSPSVAHQNVVSPSKSRIHPSAISFGVSEFGLAFSSAKARSASPKRIKEMIRIETPRKKTATVGGYARRVSVKPVGLTPRRSPDGSSLARTLELILRRRRELVLREPLQEQLQHLAAE